MPPGHTGASERALDWFECAAKVESCCVKWSFPQDGQASSEPSAERRTSFSNVVPQSLQRYSKIGIFTQPTLLPVYQ